MQLSIAWTVFSVWQTSAQELTAVEAAKLPREVVERLLWRPEDTPDRLEHSIQQYDTKVLPLVEVN